MSPKNLTALKKTHKFLLDKLKDKKTLKIYKKFEKNLKLNEDCIVAVSGGPDSLALSFLSKIYSLKNSIKIKYFIVDHKLREGSTNEIKFVKRLFKKLSLSIKVLTWIGKKPKSNIQSIARAKRYNLLINQAKKLKIKYIILGHHKNDLIENFFLRILRGSGLKGIISFDRKSEYNNIYLIRPLLNFSKEELKYLSKKIFQKYIEDPSNKNEKFKRIKLRKIIGDLQSEGLDFKKLNLTIKNLKFADNSIKFFTEKNLKNNSNFFLNYDSVFLNEDFFFQPKEIVFRSFTEVIKRVGNKHYPVRGKKIDKIILKVIKGGSFTATLGNCIIKRVNNTIIVLKEY